MRSLLLLVALGLCTPALADNKDVAREAFRDGTRYYDLAEFGKALEAFKKA